MTVGSAPPADSPDRGAATRRADGRSPDGGSATAPLSALPTLSLPAGGGAIRSIGEKFSAAPATGTGAMAVPIVTSAGRDGFGPHLALSYDSGRGNGPFGFGWSIGLPAVTRRTSKGLPRYHDATNGHTSHSDPAGEDVFVLSDVEDLVPMRDPAPGWAYAVREVDGHRVERFRPRVEGAFARVERWTRLADGDVHWQSVTRDNVTTVYGDNHGCRISDPDDPRRVFSWLISRSYDDKGNVIAYGYLADNGDGVDVAAAHEQHRTAAARATNRYLKRIRYGNRVSRLAGPDPSDPGWMFEVVLDYGDHDDDMPTPTPDRPWGCRPDPFSSYRAGFEVRTYRLCRRVLMFHHFPDEPGVGEDCLVRSTTLGYRPGEAVGEFLTDIIQSGYRRDGGGYLSRSLPPLEFDYSPATLHDQVGEVDVDSVAPAPAGPDGDGYRWVDLDSEGIAGILAEQVTGWYYHANRGGGRFAPAREVSPVPSVVGGARTDLLDLAGDGNRDVVTFSGPNPGFFSRRHDAGGWEPFVAFRSLPHLDWNDPHLRVIDLDGDGHADILITGQDALVWYPSLAEEGFGPAQRVTVPLDEDQGPRLVFADATGSVHLADMSGDGLTDLVRIRNGEVCYWPNLGRGRFGARVVMDDAPWFDRAGQYDPRRLLLADVDGSGVVDLIYLGHDGARIYLNRSGNGWCPPHLIATAPATDDGTRVSAVDLFGTGTTCLVWPPDRTRPEKPRLRYIDLLGSTHPHLLVSTVNNLGAETHVSYAPSTTFYLADKAAGRPWLSRLPFPVQVVEKVTTIDRISRNRFVTRYAYHHGHFDGVEREFRGFGMVEQWDTEELSALGGEVDLNPDTGVADPASHVPPVLTRTWFHTGEFAPPGQGQGRRYAPEYWHEPGLTAAEREEMVLDDPAWPETIRLADGGTVPHTATADELREAHRARKGAILRQEVYGSDGTAVADVPYLVTSYRWAVDLLQPRLAGDRHAVCHPYQQEKISHHYERRLVTPSGADGSVEPVADPRVGHEVTLEVNGYGDAVRAVAVGYPRRHVGSGLPDAVRTAQSRIRVLLSVHEWTAPVDTGPDHRGPLPAGSRTYELVNLDPPAAPATFTADQLRSVADAVAGGGHDLPPEDTDGAGITGSDPHRRLLTHSRTVYRRDDLAGPLPPGVAGTRGLPYETYQLALTPERVAHLCRPPDGGDPGDHPGPEVTEVTAALSTGAGYLADDDGWWVPSGRVFHSPDPTHDDAAELVHARAHFFRPGRMQDPFGNTGTVTYDRYDLLVAETRDAAGNRQTVGRRLPGGTVVEPGNDYRVLQPWLLTDPNGNHNAAAFDALGMVSGTAVIGKEGEETGDSLAGFDADLPPDRMEAYVADPLADPYPVLGGATARVVNDLDAYRRTRQEPWPQPVASFSLARRTHVADLPPGQVPQVEHRVAYTDGLGREIQVKTLADDGPVDPGGPSVTRWIGSGWTVFNNKGDPVRQYEPFHSGTHAFEAAHEVGVSPVLGYDPVGRMVATLAPDGSHTKVVVDPWQSTAWDGNDTVLVDPRTDPDTSGPLGAHLATMPGWQTWSARRAAGGMGMREQQAAAKAAAHAGTPVVSHTDALGRVVAVAVHNRLPADDGATGNGVDRIETTVSDIDIQGHRRAVVDPLGRVVARYGYDLAGGVVRAEGMDSGTRLTLRDAAGAPIRVWDSRGHTTSVSYDPLRRPVEVWIRRRDGSGWLASRTEYGEQAPDASARNLRGRVHRLFDGSGIATTGRYDVKGNPLATSRQLTSGYHAEPDWSGEVALASEVHTGSAGYDARNRLVHQTLPDGSDVHRRYDPAGRLSGVDLRRPGATTATASVAAIGYDPRGQRTHVVYGNGVRTDYEYDPETFRIRRLRTIRGGERLQDLTHTYDPAGNLTHLDDGAQQTVFFRNQAVEPGAGYTYDAAYRLVAATGREHLGQHGGQPAGPLDRPGAGHWHPADGGALGRYHQRYAYDAVGNLLVLAHRGTDPAHPGWTRTFHHHQPSRLEPSVAGDRLSRCDVGGSVEEYRYDAHGNVTALPHLPELRWDHGDRLLATVPQVVGAGAPATTWHRYADDDGGGRVRTVTDRPAAAGATPTPRSERINLGGIEIYREYGADPATVVLERITLHLADDQHRFALVEARTAGDDGSPAELVRYQVGDRLGSVCLEVDAGGRVISQEEFAPYGSSTLLLGEAATTKRYRFSGKERDEVSGLSYHGARYYAPWLGRWMSPDPAGLVDGTNLYAYVAGNPVRYHDPTGRSAVDDLRNSRVVTDEQKVKLQMHLDFEKRGIPFASEVRFTLVDAHGKDIINKETGQPLTGFMDFVYLDPEDSQFKFVELKGRDGSSRTRSQLQYHPLLEKGGGWRIEGYKGQGIGLSRGSTGSSAGAAGFRIVSMDNLTSYLDSLREKPVNFKVPHIYFTGEGRFEKVVWRMQSEAQSVAGGPPLDLSTMRRMPMQDKARGALRAARPSGAGVTSTHRPGSRGSRGRALAAKGSGVLGGIAALTIGSQAEAARAAPDPGISGQVAIAADDTLSLFDSYFLAGWGIATTGDLLWQVAEAIEQVNDGTFH
jgi:RHS repeat-associated protein